MDGTEDDAIYDENDSSDEECLNDVAERMELVDISDVSEEEFHGFYDE